MTIQTTAIPDITIPGIHPIPVSIHGSRPTNKVFVKFSDVIYGDKWPYDFAITEIEFYGN